MKCTSCVVQKECNAKNEWVQKIDGTCQHEKRKEFLCTMLCINAGVVGASAGVFLTLTRKTPLAITLSTALFGASSSLITTPIQHKFNGKRFTFRETLDAAALSACESAPLGLLIRLSRLKHICIGASTGVTYNFIENAHPTSLAAMMGIIGGLSTHIASLFCQSNSEIFRALSRIGLEMFIVMLIDCAIEIYQQESHFWANFFTQFSVILVSEFAQNLTRRTHMFNKMVNLELIRGNFCKNGIRNTKQFESQLLDIHAQINSLPSHVIAENLQRVKMYNNFQHKLGELKFYNKFLGILKQNNSLISNAGQKLEQFFNLPRANEIKRFEKLAVSMRPQLMGHNNMHFLIGPRSGQIAVDLNVTTVSSGKRNAERVIFEKYYGKFIYTDHTLKHDYRGCRKSSRNFINDPTEALRIDHINRIFLKNNEN